MNALRAFSYFNPLQFNSPRYADIEPGLQSHDYLHA